jgi:predicted dehydrogenase
MRRTLTRRDLLRSGALASGAILLTRSAGARRRGPRSPNEQLDLGVIGVGNRGWDNLSGVASENVKALCDVDRGYLAAAAAQFPAAARYVDFRNMLEHERLDAVVVSTPDHVHAPAALAALRLGLHVYCEKPLAHTVREARLLADEARARGRATQMGTQIHAGSNYRRVVELVRAGSIGEVHAVHVFCSKSWGAKDDPKQVDPVPEALRYDLWLGPAAERPFHRDLHPASWRRYWDFGGGTLADMACHYVDLPFWALELDYPTSVEVIGPHPHPRCAPEWLMARWRFPARASRGALDLHWYDGGRRPEALQEYDCLDWTDGVLFLGQRGALIADYERHELLPRERFRDHVPPQPTISESIGHHAEWIEACKTGARTTCAFDYSGPLTETVLLGIVAHRRAIFGKVYAWDAERLRMTNDAESEALLVGTHRKGWEV